jgi:predicted methyltransferase
MKQAKEKLLSEANRMVDALLIQECENLRCKICDLKKIVVHQAEEIYRLRHRLEVEAFRGDQDNIMRKFNIAKLDEELGL